MQKVNIMPAFGSPKQTQPPEKLELGTTRDNTMRELLNKVRFNRYDMKFLHNINIKYIINDKPVSPGQNELYEKLIHKYRKQIKKLGANYKEVLALPWQHGIVPVEVLNKQTYFNVDDQGTMQLYFNFNKKMIEEVRTLVHDDAGNHLKRGTGNHGFGDSNKYDFIWHNEGKKWHGPFSVYLFRELYYYAKKHKIPVGDSVVGLCNDMNAYGTKRDWTPHMHVVNGRIYINIITETMLPFLDKIDPTDQTVSNLEQLAKLGIAVPESVGEIAKYMTSTTDVIEIQSVEDALVLKSYITQSGRKAVLFTPNYVSPEMQKSETYSSLTDEPDASIDMNLSETLVHFNKKQSGTMDVDKLLAAGYNTLITTTPLTSLLSSQDEVGKFAFKADKIIYISIR